MENDVWAEALSEVDSPSRNAGLWARCYAEANGNEAQAKAAYVRARVTEQTTVYTCPSCNRDVAGDARLCTGCGADFGEGSTWRPVPKFTVAATSPGAPPSAAAYAAAGVAPTVVVKSARSRGIYIILGLFLGLMGIHNFYAARYARGAMQLLCSALLGWVGGIGLVITALWVFADLFTVKTDGAGDPLT